MLQMSKQPPRDNAGKNISVEEIIFVGIFLVVISQDVITVRRSEAVPIVCKMGKVFCVRHRKRGKLMCQHSTEAADKAEEFLSVP